MSSPLPEHLRELQHSVLVRVTWPSDWGRPAFAPNDKVPIEPRLQHYFNVQLHRLEQVKSDQQKPGEAIDYEPLPVLLSGQSAREHLPASNSNGITSGTIIASGDWGNQTTILVTFDLDATCIWVHGPALASSERIEFWAVPGQHFSTPQRVYPQYGQITLDRARVPLGTVDFRAERR